jgi:hypothetical protein
MPGKALLAGRRERAGGGGVCIPKINQLSAFSLGGHLFWECTSPGASYYAETSVLFGLKDWSSGPNPGNLATTLAREAVLGHAGGDSCLQK